MRLLVVVETTLNHETTKMVFHFWFQCKKTLQFLIFQQPYLHQHFYKYNFAVKK